MATRYDLALGRKPVQPVPHVEEPIPVLKSVFHIQSRGLLIPGTHKRSH